MKHAPPASALEELKKELKSRSSSKSPIPQIREQVTALLPEFISNFSSFNGKPEFGSFLASEKSEKSEKRGRESDSESVKRLKMADSNDAPGMLIDHDCIEDLGKIPPGKWNEIGKKFKNLAQDFSAKDKSLPEIKLGAIYFLSSSLSYLQGSVLRKDFLSEYNSCQELLNVTFSRLNKTQLPLLLSLLCVIDSTLNLYAIELSHKKLKSLNSKIEALEKVSDEENTTREISDLKSKITAVKDSIFKFSEVSVRRIKDSCKFYPDFYKDSITLDILKKVGPISLFSQIQDISLIGISILLNFLQESKISDFNNLWAKD